jgi:hypothetical protein
MRYERFNVVDGPAVEEHFRRSSSTLRTRGTYRPTKDLLPIVLRVDIPDRCDATLAPAKWSSS